MISVSDLAPALAILGVIIFHIYNKKIIKNIIIINVLPGSTIFWSYETGQHLF